MKRLNIIKIPFRHRPILGTLIFTFILLLSAPVYGQAQVGLYDVWETKITNSKSYSNPFDYNVIELRATFTSPTGKKFNFFGFYDGNGNGGQSGNVWKLRFMPDKVGTWKYTYSWTDGTSGGSGNFKVVDSGLRGPLKVATDNSWYFMDSRGKPFHFRGYDMHGDHLFAPTNSYLTYGGWIRDILQKKAINNGYNFTMWDTPSNRKRRKPTQNTSIDTWWINSTEKKKFNVAVWREFEKTLGLAKDNGVYVITFTGMVHHTGEYAFSDFKVFLRYWVARFSPFYNFFGWSPSWEWLDIWSSSDVNNIMSFVYNNDPWKRMLGTHDCSHNSFSPWLGFSMRQSPSQNIFGGNSRTAFWNQFPGHKALCGSESGIGSKFVNKPIVGSEDLWEIQSGQFGQPRNKTEVRRGAWGAMMAGVMPLYSEWTLWTDSPGNMPGEPEVRKMFDFFYSKTKYRQYKQLNSLVSRSSRQIASGKQGLEYLVYDENGGSITINLSGAGGSNTFDVLWYNPTSGASQKGGKVEGGASRTLNSPYAGDTVLLLTKGAADTTAPSAPKGLHIK